MSRSYLRALAIPAIGATVLGLTATGASAVARPDNDLFNRAENITAGGCNASAEGDNVNATGQPGEPLHFNATVLDFQSVWYKWTSPVTDTVVVDTIGSDYDTILAVYRGRRVDSLTQIRQPNGQPAADDDAGGEFTSQTTFEARRGVTYRIAVDSFRNNEGNILLNVTC